MGLSRPHIQTSFTVVISFVFGLQIINEFENVDSLVSSTPRGWYFCFSSLIIDLISFKFICCHPNRPFATNDHMRDLNQSSLTCLCFNVPVGGIIMSLPSSMADFVPCDRLLQKAY